LCHKNSFGFYLVLADSVLDPNQELADARGGIRHCETYLDLT